MDAIQHDIRVTFRFPVCFTRDVFNHSNPILRSLISTGRDPAPADVIFVVDSGVVDATPGIIDRIERYCAEHRDAIRLAAPVTILPGGEDSKNHPQHVTRVYEAIEAGHLCRHSYVVAVGGGAVLDVVGYAAATAHRGIRLIRVPTTVLAQDDSAVGVKNGVNGFGKKNYFGTFAPPFAVVNDFAFLTTLLDRDWLGGATEAVKVALIKDPTFFDWIEANIAALGRRDDEAMETLVRRSAALHLAHIASAGDPFEAGSSRPLDFGHWAAHRLERLTQHRLRHGEAVGLGMALDSTYACLTGRLSETDWRRILTVLLALNVAVYVPELDRHLHEPDHEESVFRGLAEFREHLGGELTVMLLTGIGRAVDVHEIDTGAMIRSIEVLKKVEGARAVDAAAESLLTGPTA